MSDREREVAAAVAAGGSNADIAAQLYLSEATVKAYVSTCPGCSPNSTRPTEYKSRS